MKKKLRLISSAMLVIAVVFVICALSAPNLGRVIYFGSYAFGARQWRVCYAAYIIVMFALFAASFFVKKSKKAPAFCDVNVRLREETANVNFRLLA